MHGSYKRYQSAGSGVSPRLIPGSKLGFAVVDTDEHTEEGQITESAGDRIKQVDKRARKMTMLAKEVQEPWFIGDEDASILLLAWGSLYGPVAEAVALCKASGVKVGALVFGDLWPLPRKELDKRVPKAKFVINVEQNESGQLAGLIREYTGYAVSSSILKYDGRQISPAEIVDRLASVLEAVAEGGNEDA